MQKLKLNLLLAAGLAASVAPGVAGPEGKPIPRVKRRWRGVAPGTGRPPGRKPSKQNKDHLRGAWRGDGIVADVITRQFRRQIEQRERKGEESKKRRERDEELREIAPLRRRVRW